MNCWEFMKCGRDKGGVVSIDKRSCPAYPYYGKNCAQVAGTLCGGEIQGIYAMKIFDCVKCTFYNSRHYQHTSSNPQVMESCNCSKSVGIKMVN